jgi:hypothetical protein
MITLTSIKCLNILNNDKKVLRVFKNFLKIMMTAFQKSKTYLKHHFFVNFLNNPIDMGWAIIITFNNFSAISYLFITKGRKARNGEHGNQFITNVVVKEAIK